MARDEDAGHFEWVNAWASAAPAQAAAPQAKPAPTPAAVAVPPTGIPRYTVTGSAEATTIAPDLQAEPVSRGEGTAPPPPDQLMRDIAEIERTRDALADGALSQRMRAFMLVPSRTTDATPLMIGGVLALAMLTVFGAAAAVSKFSPR